jgi:hypothetical protein
MGEALAPLRSQGVLLSSVGNAQMHSAITTHIIVYVLFVSCRSTTVWVKPWLPYAPRVYCCWDLACLTTTWQALTGEVD